MAEFAMVDEQDIFRSAQGKNGICPEPGELANFKQADDNRDTISDMEINELSDLIKSHISETKSLTSTLSKEIAELKTEVMRKTDTINVLDEQMRDVRKEIYGDYRYNHEGFLSEQRSFSKDLDQLKLRVDRRKEKEKEFDDLNNRLKVLENHHRRYKKYIDAFWISLIGVVSTGLIAGIYKLVIFLNSEGVL